VSSMDISAIVFACLSGGALFGMFIRAVLPGHQLGDGAKDVLKLGIGLVATLSALALGLLISSAKRCYDTRSTEVTEASAKIILLHRALAHYGPETKEASELLRNSVAVILKHMWPKETTMQVQEPTRELNSLYDNIPGLLAKDDKQRRWIQAQALNIPVDLGQTRWLMYEQRSTSISKPLLITLVFWLITVFIGFGLFAPHHGTVVTSLLVSAAVGFLCRLLDAGVVHTLCRTVWDFECPPAWRFHAPGPIGDVPIDAFIARVRSHWSGHKPWWSRTPSGAPASR
jgi:hypothetical protein